MLKAATAPHLRAAQRPTYQSYGMLLCLVPLTAFSCLHYGIRPLLLVLSGILSALVTECICGLFRHGRPTMSDATCTVTGGLIGAMMSPLAPFWVPAIGSAFAIGVVKMPFGGTGRNIFNPAAAGMAFCAVCFPTRLFMYPDPTLTDSLPLLDTSAVITAASPTAQLNSGGTTSYGWLSLLSGDFPGPIGSTGVLILLACALYLFARRSSSPLILVPYLIVCAIGAALFPRASITAVTSVSLELCTGLLLFSGVFLLSDPVTAPRFWLARILYGVIAAILTMILRHYGRFECGEFFAVMLVNSFSPLLDRSCWHLTALLRRKREEVAQI
ncbi:MAG: RnfABCDGE type electron transport complex subunit D [Clostridia bacterium]|nr:RnfABCDGE type electron transport complex subunit D [Clostridia bacterium]